VAYSDAVLPLLRAGPQSWADIVDHVRPYLLRRLGFTALADGRCFEFLADEIDALVECGEIEVITQDGLDCYSLPLLDRLVYEVGL